jgi:hypothetical protein
MNALVRGFDFKLAVAIDAYTPVKVCIGHNPDVGDIDLRPFCLAVKDWGSGKNTPGARRLRTAYDALPSKYLSDKPNHKSFKA